MAIIESWLPPTRQHYELILFWWNFLPLVCPRLNWKYLGLDTDFVFF